MQYFRVFPRVSAYREVRVGKVTGKDRKALPTHQHTMRALILGSFFSRWQLF